MRIRRLTALLAAGCMLLSGCQVSGEVENQAYVLVLGVDRLENGDLLLTAKVPKVGKGSEKGAESDSGSPYIDFSASGPGWSGALEALQWATPRQSNLSHIEMLAVSEALAREEGFPELVNQIAETPHLYTTARLVVCRGDAKAFVEAGKAVIGTRLSAELNAMLKHYAAQGYIPDSSFAELYYAANAIYSDPVAILGSLSGEDAEGGAAIRASPAPQRFAGAALFRGGRLVGALDLARTRLLNLIRGQSESFPFECNGRTFELTPVGKPDKRVEIGGDGARVRVELRLSTLDGACDADARTIEGALSEQIRAVVRACQRLRVDPFGFADIAAGHFLTVPDWLAFNWREQYVSADVEVRVTVEATGME